MCEEITRSTTHDCILAYTQSARPIHVQAYTSIRTHVAKYYSDIMIESLIGHNLCLDGQTCMILGFSESSQ